MINKNKTEIIDHIRKVFQEHENSHRQGSWEQFQRHKRYKIRARIFKTTMVVAASLLIVLSFAFINQQNYRNDTDKNIATSEDYTPEIDSGMNDRTQDDSPASKPEPDPIIADESRSDTQDELAGNIPALDEPQEDSRSDTTDSPPNDNRLERISIWSGKILYDIPNTQRIVHTDPVYGRSHIEYPDIVQNNLRGRNDNLSFGITYASLMHVNDSKTDWSIGGGFFTEWRFARNLAFSSGLFLSQNKLEYSDNNTLSVNKISDSAYMQVDIMSLEIPLNIRYFVMDKFSVSAGISSAALLRENYNYVYENELEIQVLQHDAETGYAQTSRSVTLKETEEFSEPGFNALHWAAFYNISVGYSHAISDKHALLFEPFVKLPRGNFASREIKYVTGGVQLKISF